MDTLSEIYEVLKSEGLCASQMEFSQNWLGRSAHYMAQIKGDASKASSTSLMLLESKIQAAKVQAQAYASRETFMALTRAWMAAKVMVRGEYELRHVPPWFRVTAIP